MGRRRERGGANNRASLTIGSNLRTVAAAQRLAKLHARAMRTF